MILEQNKFTGPFSIGQIESDFVYNRVLEIASYREVELMHDVLGESLYDELIDGLSKPEDAPDDWAPAEKWTALKNEVSIIITAYVFYWDTRINNEVLSGGGNNITRLDNSVRISPQNKLTYAWNTVSKSLMKVHCFIWDANKKTPPDYESYKPSTGRFYKYQPINTFNL